MSGSISGIIEGLSNGEKSLNAALSTLKKSKGDKDAIKRLTSVLRDVVKTRDLMGAISKKDFSKLHGFNKNIALMKKLIKDALDSGEDVRERMLQNCFSSKDAYLSIHVDSGRRKLGMGVWLFGDQGGMTMNGQSSLDEKEALDTFKSVLEDAIYESYDDIHLHN